MHENMKVSGNAFMWFSKVIIYKTNTKKKWSKLTKRETKAKGFKFIAPKLFVVSKNREVTQQQIEDALLTNPDFNEQQSGINDKSGSLTKDWKYCSSDYIIYGAHPITEYDLKLIINLLGIRMIQFVSN